MFGKPFEFWAVLFGMAIYVATRDAEKESIKRRAFKTLASAALTYALAPSLAPWVWKDELIAAVVIMAFGLLVLDLLTALITDREFIRDLVRKRLGGRDE